MLYMSAETAKDGEFQFNKNKHFDYEVKSMTDGNKQYDFVLVSILNV